MKGNYIMGICEILTIIFVIMKLIGVIAWSWWLVLLPELIAIGLYVIGAILSVFGFKIFAKKYFDD